MSEIIALLYNTKEELDTHLNAVVDHLVGYKLLEEEYTFVFSGVEITYLACKCNYESVMQRFSGVILSGYFVAGHSLYDGLALQYVASRVRRVK